MTRIKTVKLANGVEVQITTTGSFKKKRKRKTVKSMTAEEKVNAVEFKWDSDKLLAYTPARLGGGADSRHPTEYRVVRRNKGPVKLPNLNCGCPAKRNFFPGRPCKHMKAVIGRGLKPPVGSV